VQDIGHRVRDVMVETPFQVPNDLLMLIRTIAILSGMCTGLDPNFNLWEQLSPYASKLVQEEASSAFSVDNILKQVGDVLQAFIALPSQASRLLSQMESGGLVVQTPQVTREVRTLGRSVDRLTGGIIFAALLVSGTALLNSGISQLGGVLLGAAGATLLWVMFGGRGRS
jgi:predicted unusual protein kinase regulating ubiquinone biosynthesis (AarF/ABC1/UbiB family)